MKSKFFLFAIAIQFAFTLTTAITSDAYAARTKKWDRAAFTDELLLRILDSEYEFVTQKESKITFCYGVVQFDFLALDDDAQDFFYEVLAVGRLILSDGKIYDISGVSWEIAQLPFNRRINHDIFDVSIFDGIEGIEGFDEDTTLVNRRDVIPIREMVEKKAALSSMQVFLEDNTCKKLLRN